ncbi:putative long chain fatty acid CoA ligase [Powellomyces hirtus]|nr:putative long chain fatty acid CoA ligase [Powellomyces hirtus]
MDCPRRFISTSAKLPLFRQAVAHVENTAIVARNEKYTYGQLMDDACLVRRTVLQNKHLAGKASGRRIAFLCPPGYDFVRAQWGIWAAGAISVPLCISHPPPELEYTLMDSGADTVIFHSSLQEHIMPVRDRLKGVNWIDIESSSQEDGKSAEGTPANVSISTQLTIWHSGTTGKPKGVLTTHKNLQAQVQSLAEAWKFTADDKILNVLPLHHVHRLRYVQALTLPLWSGATVEFITFDAEKVWNRWIDKRDLSVFMAVPTIYSKLIQHYETMSSKQKAKAREACSQFRLMVSGSAALPDTIFQKWETISGHRLLERYGMTEIGMALGNPYEGPRIPGTVGKPFPGVKASIRDQNDQEISGDGPISGELFVSGPQVFEKYWNKPEATAKELQNGWFRTGDIVSRNEDGVYSILGRASVDIIKTGGYKISALDIERELLSYPAVADVAVLGLPSEEWGEIIAAMVVFGKQSAEIETLRQFLKDRMAPYKVPRKFLVVDELPRNVMGKVNKKGLVKFFADKA